MLKFLTQKLYLHSELEKILLLEIRSLPNGVSIFKRLSFRHSVPGNITTRFIKKKTSRFIVLSWSPSSFKFHQNLRNWHFSIKRTRGQSGIFWNQFMWTSILFLSLWSWWQALTKKERKKERLCYVGMLRGDGTLGWQVAFILSCLGLLYSRFGWVFLVLPHYNPIGNVRYKEYELQLWSNYKGLHRSTTIALKAL